MFLRSVYQGPRNPGVCGVDGAWYSLFKISDPVDCGNSRLSSSNVAHAVLMHDITT